MGRTRKGLSAAGRPGGGSLRDADIVAAGLTLLDEVGWSQFTMRALADRVNAFPNSIYWHVGGRDRVVALVVERALGEIVVPSPPADDDWRPWLAAVAREYRRVLHAHPNVAPIVTGQVLVSPPSLKLVEAILAVLRRAGFDGPRLTLAYNTFVGSVVGWVSVELAVPPPGPVDWQTEFESAIRGIDATAHPTIAEHRDQLADTAFALRWHGGQDRPLDASFEAALAVWLDGLAVARAK